MHVMYSAAYYDKIVSYTRKMFIKLATGCMVVRPIPGQPDACSFQWLLELDYGGWVPSCMVNLFLPFAQVCCSQEKHN